MTRKCKQCSSIFIGRSDKVFCSIGCKNHYNTKERKERTKSTFRIDEILHKNRSILHGIMGKSRKKMNVSKMELDKKKFNYTYMTGYSINKVGKTYHHIYEFSYMTFSNQSILIVRNSR